ncbi:MAG: 6,7-dimethyl-8-ribityllumazine synthase [FCB group bacterium]|nr:6,7-dimethyl-8-ribityllumazine synthase [FCB group bacterium]
MTKIIEGNLDASGKEFGIVVSRFNSLITDNLLRGAIDCLKRHGADEKRITVVYVPGAFEISPAARKLTAKENIDAVICLGAVIRGETPHFDFVAGEVSKGLGRLAYESDKAVSFGILTTDSLDQALERAGSKGGNKGWEAALAVLEMVSVLGEI